MSKITKSNTFDFKAFKVNIPGAVLPKRPPPDVEVAVDPNKPPVCAVGAPNAGAAVPNADVPAAGAGCPKAGCVAPKALDPKADPPGVLEPNADF